MWEGRISTSATPPLQGMRSSAPQFRGSLLFAHILFDEKKTEFDVVTYMGKGLVYWGYPRLRPKEAKPQRIPSSGVFLYYAPPLIGGGIKPCFCMTSDVCLSRTSGLTREQRGL